MTAHKQIERVLWRNEGADSISEFAGEELILNQDDHNGNRITAEINFSMELVNGPSLCVLHRHQ